MPQSDYYALESADQLSPAELFEFSVNNTSYYYTSGDSPIVYNGNTYTPETIHRSETELTTDINKNTLTITTHKNNAVADLFIAGTPPSPVFIVLHRVHQGSDLGGVLYSGRITSCSFSGFEATLACEPIFTSIKRVGLRRYYEATCTHSIYDESCDPTGSLRTAASVTGATFDLADNRIIYIPGLSTDTDVWSGTGSATGSTTADRGFITHAGLFTGGFIQLADGSKFMIAEHGSGYIKLLNSLPDGVTPTSFDLYKGCDHSTTICQSRFNNVINFGGFPFMPDSNPFVGTHVPQGG